MPLADFSKYESMIREYRMNPEIGLVGDSLYSLKRQDFIDRAKFLEDEGLRCTLHAPFHDMMPGAQDEYVLKATREKLRRCFDLIEIFRPESVVCHLGYVESVHSYDLAQWLDNSLETWKSLLSMAEELSTPVVFENTYEPGPRIHKMLLEALNSPSARFCLDVGHLLAFARVPWPQWLSNLEQWLAQLHLHDNLGFRDEHLPVGKGVFDFAGLFSHLKARKITPIITLEPRNENDLLDSLNALDRLGLFDHKSG
ncbi:sugar phosphate isomerase/epimerase family protein [Thermodesulfobacteriota bacterium]